MLDRQIECLKKCLEELPPASRELIIEYYYGETSTRIKNRKSLAQRLGVQTNTLRVKALRIREKLEACFYATFRKLPTA